MGTVRRAPIPFPRQEDLTGTKVGRFVIHSKLGAGGMGEIYYAEDTALRRPVALKRVSRKLSGDSEARRRILREAQHASLLTSEHIASIHDVLEEEGEIFVVMEYVEGETLRQRLRRPTAIEEFYPIAQQCALALIAAHEHGIVHCDIKPENIMINSERQVKILDFGLAKHLPRADPNSTTQSTPRVAGTLAYMAPEVLLERLPDARTDIFSLGIVFYEMLTLRNPFHDASFVATSERTLHETPVAISLLNPSVPVALEALIMKMLAKAPSQRYENARELLKDLRAVQEGVAPRTVSGPTSRIQSSTLKRRLIAAFVLIMIIASAVGIYRWLHRPPILAARGWILISDFDVSGDPAIPDKAVREGLTIALQQSRYVNVFPRARVYEVLRRMKKEDAARIDETLGREICQRENLQVLLSGGIERVGDVFQISVRGLDPQQGNLLFGERERFNQADQFFEKADVLAKKMREDLGESFERIEKSSRPLAKVTTSSMEALQLYSRAKDALDRGRNEEVEGLLKSALQLDRDFAMAHLRLGQYYQAVVGKNERAVAELERAYQLRQGVTDREQRGIEAAYYNLQERYEDEAQSLKVLLSLYPDDEDAHQELAGAYYNLDQIDKAIVELRDVLRLNPSSASAYGNLVLYLVHKGQVEEALATAAEAAQRGVDSPSIHWGLGLAQLYLGDASSARQEFQRIGRGTDTERELQELNLALADLYEGKLEAAKLHIVKQIEAAAPRNGGLQTIRLYLLGRIDLSQDHLREAKLEADRILQVPVTGLQIYDLFNAGVLYAEAGRLDRAREVARRLDDTRRSVPTSWNQSCFHNLEGEIALTLAKPDNAAVSFSAAIQEYPQAISYAGLARAYQAQQQWESATREWEQVLRRKAEILQNGYPPDLAYAHLQLARAYARLRQPNLALSHFEEVLRMWQHGDRLPMLLAARHESQSTLELPPANDQAENRTRGSAENTKPK